MAFELELKRSKKPVYPTKTSINLVTSNQPPRNVGRNAALFAVAMVAVLLFAKFGVVDVMAAAQAATGKVASAQAELSALQADNADFADLEERYAAFAVNSLTDEERVLADRGEVLDLLSSTVAGAADLQSVRIAGNTVELQFANTSLDDVSRVVASLEDEEAVATVSMSTAKTDKNDDVVSTVTIILKGTGEVPQGEGEDAGAPAAGKGASNE
ncbi:hypothetical protein [Arabiibacter massiliensis]|uniref:hypothetical protein n=1 Tax=Arabiibacter massiliensis TaxID=1870985 RepID=UPI0009BADC91|nr:hypothetical protein [Arabiibacter massiliensis]